MALLEVSKVGVAYYGSGFELKDVNLSLDDGQKLVIYGLENSGKTTLLRALCGLEEYGEGDILLDGAQLKGMSQKDMNIGFTFDKRVLDRKATAQNTISYPMKLRGIELQRIDKYIESVADRLNIPMQSQIKDLNDLQVANLILARLFAVDRRLYLIDDVWKDLPQEEKEFVIAYLLEEIRGKSVIIATDDRSLAKDITTDKIVVLTDKQVLPMQSAEEISNRPLNMQSASFAEYELHIGQLVKIEEEYFAHIYGERYRVGSPIGDVYVGKRVCFAVKRNGDPGEKGGIGDGVVMSFYYDIYNERIISM